MTKDTAIGQQNMAFPFLLEPGSVMSGPVNWAGAEIAWKPYGQEATPILAEGAKLDDGKVGVHLLPPDPLIQIARVLDYGAKKYAAYNWAKGIKYSRVYAAAMRHLFAWWKGDNVDPETGLSHLAHAGCCVLFLLQYELTKRDFDDRPVKEYSDGPTVST